MKIEKSDFGSLTSEEKVYKYKLSNSSMSIEVINYGGIITNINFPNSEGKKIDIVLGFNHLDQYLDKQPYFGAIIGRYGNRIYKGRFNVSDKLHQLKTNNGEHALHGGIKGFDKVIWSVEEIIKKGYVGLKLNYLSRDMEEGYPGNLNVNVTYILNSKDELKIIYEAVTDSPTIINLTQHSYFNLAGESSGDILNHMVSINADFFLPIDEGLIPTGEFKSVNKTPFDFRELKKIGKDINLQNNQLKYGLGYDHCWVLNNSQKGIRKVSQAKSLKSGIQLDVFSDQPGIQFYTGNFLDGSLKSKNLKAYEKRAGFCFETQHFPDSPNKSNFPNVILNISELYKTETWYKFSNTNR